MLKITNHYFNQIAAAACVLAACSTHATASIVFNTVALSGDKVPGIDNAVFTDFNVTPALSSNGQTAFIGKFANTIQPGVQGEGAFVGDTLIARTGTAAPGTNGANFDAFFSLSLNDNGNLAFTSRLEGSNVDLTNDIGIFTPNALVARKGNEAANINDEVFSDFHPVTKINNNDDVAFAGAITTNGFQNPFNLGVFTSNGLVAKAGDPAPDTNGETFVLANNPSINDNGETVFRGFLTNNDSNNANNGGIFTTSKLFARDGDEAPGTNGARYDFFYGEPAINNKGDVAFSARLSGSGVTEENNSGIFTPSTLIVREGNNVPGMNSVKFGEFGSPSMDESGNFAFSSRLVGNGINTQNDTGIFASLLDGSIAKIIQEGDRLEVGINDIRTVSNLGFFRGLDSDGEDLSFIASFTDDSKGIFTANFAALNTSIGTQMPVPAPTSTLLFAFAMLGLWLRAKSTHTLIAR